MPFCNNCGARVADGTKFCGNCGKPMPVVAQTPPAVPTPPVQPVIPPMQVEKAHTQSPEVQPNEPVEVYENPMVVDSIPESAVEASSDDAGAPLNKDVSKKHAKKQKKLDKKAKKAQKKNGKKRRVHWLVKLLLIVLLVAGLLVGAWYAFGNIITLNIHADDVAETISSGSLNLSGNENHYAQLPDYIKDMITDDSVYNETGPLMGTVLPYVSVKKKAVHGFFGDSTVEYTISAPDVETWLVNYEMTEDTTEQTILAELAEYVKTAPSREVVVTIEYTKDGFFSWNWRGYYKTREFVDAVSGGMNTAYNIKYQQALEELEEMFK